MDYLDFKKAFELYVTSKSSSTTEIINNLKSRMNTKRTDFALPESHQLRITPYWVLGFVEGEGSFSIRKQNLLLTFSLSQKNNTVLMKAIREFFNELGVSHGWRSHEGVVIVSSDKRISNTNDINYLYVNRVDYITNVLIPFFDSLTWLSKKEKDYNDWKTVLELKNLGLHYVEEGVKVINLIIGRMNNNRLSTSTAGLSQPRLDALQRDIEKLLSGPSNFETKEDGRIFIKSLNKYHTGGGSIKVELQEKNGLVLNTFYSIRECAEYLGVASATVASRVHKNQSIIVDGKELFIKRKRDKIDKGAKASKILGPKFLHKKSISYWAKLRSSGQTNHEFWSKHILPLVPRRQLHGKAKLAFILPNYKPRTRIGPHHKDVISVLVGSLLGDGHAERLQSGGVRFRFRQKAEHKDYLFWLWDFFKKRGYCSNNLPVYYVQNGQYEAYRFGTYGFSSLLWLYKLFYNNNKKVKVIPKNIVDLLTPLALAILIMDDGTWKQPGVRIATNCFTKQEVELLSLALETKFNLKSSYEKNNMRYQLYIKKESIPLLRKLALPYTTPSMLYKLGL